MSGNGEPVFNLVVEGAPEFFANGVLVHNCDALAYAAMDSLVLPVGRVPTTVVATGANPQDGISGKDLERLVAAAEAKRREGFKPRTRIAW